MPTPQMWYSKEFTAVEIVCEPVQVPSLAPMIGAPHFAHCLKKGEQRAQTFDNAFHEKAGSSWLLPFTGFPPADCNAISAERLQSG